MSFADGSGGGRGDLLFANRGGTVQAEAATLENCGECAYDAGIKFRTGKRVDDAHYIRRIHGSLVRTIGGHGVKSICHHDDARHERDLLAFEAIRIAASVE